MNALIGSVASIPSRVKALQDMVRSVVDQVDRLHVCLNGYEAIPHFLENDRRIQVFQSSGETDRGDAGKFHPVERYPYDYFLPMDDDLIYPKDYVKRMKAKIDEYDKKKVISYHGVKILSPEISSYYRGSRKIYHFSHQLNVDTPVHVGGTGVMGFHTSALKVIYKDFEYPNMADIFIYRLCQEQQVGILCPEHKPGWINQNTTVDVESSIWGQNNMNDALQTAIINSFPLRKLY